jgi:nucleotide-binding universal stress UspA family protein
VEEMMRTILVPLASGLQSEPALEAALSLAKRMNSHIRTAFVRAEPQIALSYVPQAIANMITREAVEREDSKTAAEGRGRFEAWRAHHGVPASAVHHRLDSCFATWLEKVGDVEQVITHYGRVSDLIVMTRFTPDHVQAQRCFDAALFGTGRPTLLVPEKLPWDLIDHVLVAWNGSIEASRAVFGVLPLLHAAARVSLFSVPTAENDKATGEELAEALSWQGISTYDCIRQNTESIGAGLIMAAARCNASLIVMGAYTHSRLRQSFLGGVTRHVLSEADIPVVMCH